MAFFKFRTAGEGGSAPRQPESVEAMRRRGESRSDWEAAQRMPQAEIERLADAEDGPLGRQHRDRQRRAER